MKRNNLYSSIALSINISLAIPFIIKGILNNEKNVLFLISIIMAILSYLSVPYDTMDLIRYYELYDLIATSHVSMVLSDVEGNLVVNLILKGLTEIGVNRQFLPFIANLISYWFLCKTVIYVREKSSLGFRGYDLLFFTSVILFGVGFFFGGSGIRTGIALSLCLYAIANFNSKNYISFIVYSIIAITVHFLSVIIVMAVVGAYILKSKSILRLLFAISPLLAVFGVGEILVKLLFFSFGTILQSYGLYRVSYIDGEWGTAFYGLRNLNTFVYERFIYVLPFYMSYVYALIVKRKSFYRDVFYIITVAVFLFYDFRTLFMRYSYFASLLFIVILSDEYNLIKGAKKIAMMFLLSCMIYSAGSVYKYRDMFVPSWGKVIYQPTPFLFLNTVKNKDYIVRED